MPPKRTLDIYLDDALRASAVAGRHNYFGKVQTAFESAGVAVSFRPDTLAERLASHARAGYALFHMEEPPHDRALTTRRAYLYPFWRIEKTNRRWETEVADSAFDPGAIDPEEARRFARFWRRRLFGEVSDSPVHEGFLFAPLQGRLQEKRSFQTMAPLDMLRATLDAAPDRPVLATLHPNETYSAEERRALTDLTVENPRLRVVHTPAETLLAACDAVVTQNSSVAFSGYFFGKPAVLFAQIDFHHIAANVAELGVDGAFRAIAEARPAYDRYLYWFLQIMAINAGKEDAPAKILATVRRRGWEV